MEENQISRCKAVAPHRDRFREAGNPDAREAAVDEAAALDQHSANDVLAVGRELPQHAVGIAIPSAVRELRAATYDHSGSVDLAVGELKITNCSIVACQQCESDNFPGVAFLGCHAVI